MTNELELITDRIPRLYHIFLNRIGGLVRKNARAENGHDFLYTKLVAGSQDIVVDLHVGSEKVNFGHLVGIQPSNLIKNMYLSI